ncbi:MAG: hypothetical protein ACI90V_012600 [Bacillariaceae sp.]|jgi:hypothetical protein
MTKSTVKDGKRKASSHQSMVVNGDPATDNDDDEKPTTTTTTTTVTADSWSRVAVGRLKTVKKGSVKVKHTDNKIVNNNTNASTRGRGSLSGWTLCPLCEKYSNKKYALGRGIANHLQDIHTPWNPGKLAQKIHRRKYETSQREREMIIRNSRKKKKRQRLNYDDDDANNNNVKDDEDEDDPSSSFEPLISWEPTDEENKVWATKILQILQQIEEQKTMIPSVESEPESLETTMKLNKNVSSNETGGKPLPAAERSGKPAVTYRQSLPPFLMAASKGDIVKIRELVEEAKRKDNNGKKSVRAVQNNGNAKKHNNDDYDYLHLRALLNTSDRHKSIADHWAAGGGHLDCLRYLYELRGTLSEVVVVISNEVQQQLHQKQKSRALRRRDGKTCLHYAARNGHMDCIRYLLEEQHQHIHHNVDEGSGDGTTPLHLACYGGHPKTVKYLIEKFGANVNTNNDWGCGSSHWVGMTISESDESIRKLCGYLYEQCEISFVDTQGQGHTTLHKAAHRLNRHVIQWMADSKSSGGAGLQQEDKQRAGKPDIGGHKPSDIWMHMGGDNAFAEWMKTNMGW